MKKILILFALLISGTAYTQDCNIGNENNNGFDSQSGDFYKNYLLGVKFTLGQAGVLHSLNLLGQGTGAEVKMAVYDDNGGVPNNLLTQTAAATVGTGLLSLPVSDIQLTAGNYWIMAIYNSDGMHSFRDDSASTNLVYYTSLNWGTALPATAAGFTSYPGQDFTYFMEISCGGTGTNSAEIPRISLQPNPAADFIIVNGSPISSQYIIYDILGNSVMSGTTNNGHSLLDISNLVSGSYFIRLEGNSTLKFIKQ
jgi:hypothetical protein